MAAESCSNTEKVQAFWTLCSAGLHELIQPQPNPVNSLTLTSTPLTGREIAVRGCTSRNNRQQLETYCPKKVCIGWITPHIASKCLLMTTWEKPPKHCSLTWLLDTHGIKRQKVHLMRWVRTHPNQPKSRTGRLPKRGAFPSLSSCWPRHKPSCPKATSILLLPNLPLTPPVVSLPIRSV